MTRAAKPSAYKYRYGPLRLVMPWICIAAGIVMAIKGLIDVTGGEGGDAVFLLTGSGLVVLGIVAFFVYRGMARRGL